jgi:hypothetical protein
MNVVANALSRKSYANKVRAMPESKELCAEFKLLNLGIVTNAMGLGVTPTLEQEIHKGQLEDEQLKEIVKNVPLGKAPSFRIDDKGTFMVWKEDMCA